MPTGVSSTSALLYGYAGFELVEPKKPEKREEWLKLEDSLQNPF